MNYNSDNDVNGDAFRNLLKTNLQFPMEPPLSKPKGFGNFRINDALSDTMYQRNRAQDLIWHFDKEDNMNNSFDMNIEEDTLSKRNLCNNNIFGSNEKNMENFKKENFFNFELDSFLDL